MTTKEKYSLADQVIEHALNGGAEQVSVSLDEGRNNDIEVRNQKIDRLTESNRNSLTVSLYVDNKYSSHSTNRLKRDELFRFVDEAVAATRFLAEDKARSLPPEDLYYKGNGDDLHIFDAGFNDMDTKAKIDIANGVMNEAYGKDDRIISVSAFYSDWIGNRVYVTSNGFRGDSAGTYISLYSTVSVKSDKGRPSDYWYESSLFFDKLKKTGIGEKAMERALKKIGPEKINSGKYTMIVENRSADNLLSPLLDALNGYSLYQKQSFLAGCKGKAVASPLLTVIDDPLIKEGAGSRLFDGEGLAAVRRPVIEDGILRNYFIDTYYGRKLNMDPTTGSSSNLIFRLGNRNLDEMVSGIKKGILVTGFNGGNCNGSTGDFSYGIEGYLIDNGSIVHPVNEMNITGNMRNFWMNLAETGNDIIDGNSNKIPSLMFEGIDFSGI